MGEVHICLGQIPALSWHKHNTSVGVPQNEPLHASTTHWCSSIASNLLCNLFWHVVESTGLLGREFHSSNLLLFSEILVIDIVWEKRKTINVRTREEKTTCVQLNNSINIKDTMGPFKRQYQNVLLFCSILKSIVWIRFFLAYKRCMSVPQSASAVSDNSGHNSAYKRISWLGQGAK